MIPVAYEIAFCRPQYLSAIRQLALPLLVVIVGIACRAVMDKLLALRGGPAAVASYAQLCSIVDLVAGVSLAGIGVALVAAVAKAPPSHQFAWLRASLKPSLLLSGVAAMALLPALHALPVELVPRGMETETAVAAAVGWASVGTTLMMSYLVGTRRPGVAALWILGSFVPPLLLLVFSPLPSAPLNILLGHGLFGLGAAGVILVRRGPAIEAADLRRLTRFAWAGIAIGVLSPVGMLLARTQIAGVSGWDTVGHLQVVWKVNEWVMATVSGLLYIHFLPRLAAAAQDDFWPEIGRAGRIVILPALAATLILWMVIPELGAALYRHDMAPVRGEIALIMLGDSLRAVSWVFLYGLYARHAPRAVTVGEFLSVPLFALILWAGIRPTGLVEVGAAWALAYLAYAVFNGLALREVMRPSVDCASAATNQK